MMNRQAYLISLLVGLSLAMFIISCGSGVESSGSNPIPYVGSTDDAIVNATNAAEVIKLSYDSGHAGLQVINAVTYTVLEAEENDSSTGDSACVEWPGGTYRITDYTSSGPSREWFNIKYDQYCYKDNNEYIIVNGTVSYELTSFAYTVTVDYMFYPVNIAIRNASNNELLKNDFTLAGNIEAYQVPNDPTTYITQDYTLRDNAASSPQPIYKVKYSIDEELLDSFILSNKISGKFSHPTEGVVSVSTPNSGLYYSTLILPDSGTFRTKGESNTGARIVFNSDPFTVEIDTDGDGSFDDATDTIIW